VNPARRIGAAGRRVRLAAVIAALALVAGGAPLVALTGGPAAHRAAVLVPGSTLVVNSGSCGEAEFEACQVAGSLPVQRGAGPVGVQP
jgi:hypothetical protein